MEGLKKLGRAASIVLAATMLLVAVLKAQACQRTPAPSADEVQAESPQPATTTATAAPETPPADAPDAGARVEPDDIELMPATKSGGFMERDLKKPKAAETATPQQPNAPNRAE